MVVIALKISWKRYSGNFVQVRLGMIFLKTCVLGKRFTTALIFGRSRDYGISFFKLRGLLDTEWLFIDGSDIRAHQHASGARHGQNRATGTSRGTATTKIHLAVDTNGDPIDFEITGGKLHDSQIAPKLIEWVGKAEYLWGQIKAMTPKRLENVQEALTWSPWYPENLTALKVILNFMVIHIDYGIWLKMHLHV